MRLYISGQITDNPNFMDDFEKAEKFLIENNHEPVNPTKLPHEHDKSWHSYMKEDIKALLDCDGIFMLHNHEKSKGATIELKLAEHLELEIFYNSLNLSL